MAIVCVGGSHASGSFDHSTSARTIVYGGNLTPGSLLEVTVSTFNMDITVTVSDDSNGSYTDSGAGYVVNETCRVSKWYFANNGSSGIPTLTVTPSADAYISVSVDEFTGVALSSPVRTTATATGFSTTAAGPGTVAATAGDLVVAGMTTRGTESTASVDSPFTLSASLPGSAATVLLATAYDVAAGGSETPTFNSTSTYIFWAAIGVAYKPATASGNPWYAYAQQRQPVVKRRWQQSGLLWTPSYAFGKGA